MKSFGMPLRIAGPMSYARSACILYFRAPPRFRLRLQVPLQRPRRSQAKKSGLPERGAHDPCHKDCIVVGTRVLESRRLANARSDR
jgi:hypothetical protein